MKPTKKIALSAIFTALCVIIMLLGSIIQVLDLSTVALASIVVMVSMIELGKTWALGVYTASSLLAMILLPDKFAALVFALFIGFYPVLKEPLNKIKSLVLSYLARFLCFNIFFTAMILIEPFFQNAENTFHISYQVFIVLSYLFMNIVFFVFDFSLEKVAITYITSIKPRIFGKQ